MSKASYTVSMRENGGAQQLLGLFDERSKLLRDVASAADFFFLHQLAPYDPAELIPQKGDAVLARRILQQALEVLPAVIFDHDSLDQGSSRCRCAAL